LSYPSAQESRLLREVERVLRHQMRLELEPAVALQDLGLLQRQEHLAQEVERELVVREKTSRPGLGLRELQLATGPQEQAVALEPELEHLQLH
jgi:hypothetical protein